MAQSTVERTICWAVVVTTQEMNPDDLRYDGEERFSTNIRVFETPAEAAVHAAAVRDLMDGKEVTIYEMKPSTSIDISPDHLNNGQLHLAED